MDILFRTNKLRKYCNSLKAAQKQWGTVSGKRVLQRLDEMRDADSLRDLVAIHPRRCHPLIGDRKGQWTLDLKHPFRLVFELADEPLPYLQDGGIDLRRVTKVRILEVEDTHG